MRSNNFIIPLIIYPLDVMVSVGETDDQFKKGIMKFPPSVLQDLKDQLIFALPDNVKGRTVLLTTGGQTVIRIKDAIRCLEDVGTLVHEIFHATTFVLHHIGMDLKINVSCEAYAYLIEYLTNRIFERIPYIARAK